MLPNFYTCFHRCAYTSAQVLLSLLNDLSKCDKKRGVSSITLLFRNDLFNSLVQEREC